jgi:hypothetical protein
MPYTIDHSGKLRWINDAPRLRFTFPGAYRALHAYAMALRHGHDCDMAARYALYCAETTWHGPVGWRLLDLDKGRWMKSNRIEASFDRFNRLLCNTFPYSVASKRCVDKWQYRDGIDAIRDIIQTTPERRRSAAIHLHVEAVRRFFLFFNSLDLWSDLLLCCSNLAIKGPVVEALGKNHAHDCIVEPILAKQWAEFSAYLGSLASSLNKRSTIRRSILRAEVLLNCIRINRPNFPKHRDGVVDDDWCFPGQHLFTGPISPEAILFELMRIEIESQMPRPATWTAFRNVRALAHHIATSDSNSHDKMRSLARYWGFLVHQKPKGLDIWLARQSNEHTWEKDNALTKWGD